MSYYFIKKATNVVIFSYLVKINKDVPFQFNSLNVQNLGKRFT